jgi:TRAP transporter 4TM/12TM fusion protein
VGNAIIMKFDWSHAGIFRLTVTVVAVAMALYHMWAIAFGSPEAIPYRGTHLIFAMVLVFLLYRFRSKTEDAVLIAAAAHGQPVQPPKTRTPTLVDYALLVLGVLPVLHLFYDYENVTTRIFYVDDLKPIDMIMGTILTLVLLEGTRRVIGWALPLTAIVFLIYGMFIARLEPMRMMDQLYMTTEGIFGIPLAVSASYVLIFVLFGSFMERTGTGQLFMDFALAITGHTAGGPGKVAVVSSSLFGTISGSAVANVMVDGPISIPLMKRTGFPPHFAAGVEASASTGGQIMPPIMGAAAFVMAEFLAVPYAQIVIWAVIPAILYYVACFAAVHFEAKRRGLLGLPRSELPRMKSVFLERGHLFIPILTILVIMYSGYSAPMAALIGTLACFPVAALRASTRGYLNWPNFVDAFVDGAKNALAVAMACACAGIVIAVVTLSGLGIVFTQFVVGLAKDTLILALILTMCAGIVLGMGMPTTPAYIIMTALLVPAIIKLGVITPAAHMFAFYFAVLSAITPPVALAVFAAAGLAKADLWASGWAAVKIGAAGFIVPFMLVYEPALMMIGEWPHIIGAFCTASFGILLFAAGLHGYFITAANGWQRMLLVAGGLLLIDPGLVTDIIGVCIALFIIAVQWPAHRAATAAKAQTVKQAT